jgi:hypothetical protein
MTRPTFRRALVGAVLCAFVAIATPALAQTPPTPVAYGVPTNFVVLVKNCQLSTDGGITWITLWTTGIQVNVAAVARGQEILRFVQNLRVPSGTYNRLRYTVDATMTVRGSVTNGGATYYTSTGATDPTTGPAVDFTFTDPRGDTTWTHTISVTAAEGGNAYARINFVIEQGLGLYLVGAGVYKIYPNPVEPVITVVPPSAGR